MPWRVPRNPGSGKPPHNGPASGIPKTGAGWGGPAKGAGTGGPKKPRTAADSSRSRSIEHDPVQMAAINRRKMAKEARSADLLDFQEAVALNLPDHHGVVHNAELPIRIHAASHAQDRLIGKPMQPLQHSTDPDQLAGVLKRLADD